MAPHFHNPSSSSLHHPHLQQNPNPHSLTEPSGDMDLEWLKARFGPYSVENPPPQPMEISVRAGDYHAVAFILAMRRRSRFAQQQQHQQQQQQQKVPQQQQLQQHQQKIQGLPSS